METKHLSYFKIENFKNLKSVELDDIGFFNVIVGDNNVGKTNLLESLLFNPHASVFNSNLNIAMLDRGLLNSTNENKKLPVINHFNYVIGIDVERKLKINFKISGSDKLCTQEITIQQEIPNLNTPDIYTTAIQSFDGSCAISKTNYLLEDIGATDDCGELLSDNNLFDDLVQYYEDTIQTNYQLKEVFLKALQTFIPEIKNIEIKNGKNEYRYPHLIFYSEDAANPLPINLLGQGSVKILKLLMGITYFSNHRLMIDEIDNGIHYKRQKEFIKQVMLAAKKSNTQIFCTTHSIECLKAIKEAFETEELKGYQDEFRCFSLAKNKQEDIKAFKYNFEEFQSSIHLNNELR